MRPPRVTLEIAAARAVPGSAPRTPAVRAARAALWVGGLLMRPARRLFPPEDHGGALTLLPGLDAEIRVRARAPGRDCLHLYAEPVTESGLARLSVDPGRAVPLDADGRGEAVLRAVPLDPRETGVARLRLAAVDPEAPEEVAAEAPPTRIAIRGAGRLVNATLALGILAGVVLEIFGPELPFLALFVLAGLAFALIATPRGGGLRFRPAALMPLRRRLTLALAVLAGFAWWWAMMFINLGDASLADPICGEWVDKAAAEGEAKTERVLRHCSWIEGLRDNLTALAGIVGLTAAIALALAPAFRPRRMAGYAFLIATAVIVMLFDLPLLGFLPDLAGPTDVIRAYFYGFLGVGWGFGALALGALALHFGARGRAVALLGVAAGLMTAPMAWAVGGNLSQRSDPVWLMTVAVVLVFHLALALAARLALDPGRGVRRKVLFCVAIGVASAGGFVMANGIMDGSDNRLLPFLVSAGPIVLAVLWGLVEVGLWRWRGPRRRAARRAAAGDDGSAPAPAEVAPAPLPGD